VNGEWAECAWRALGKLAVGWRQCERSRDVALARQDVSGAGDRPKVRA
jgi:hypothetical protein